MSIVDLQHQIRRPQPVEPPVNVPVLAHPFEPSGLRYIPTNAYAALSVASSSSHEYMSLPPLAEVVSDEQNPGRSRLSTSLRHAMPSSVHGKEAARVLNVLTELATGDEMALLPMPSNQDDTKGYREHAHATHFSLRFGRDHRRPSAIFRPDSNSLLTKISQLPTIPPTDGSSREPSSVSSEGRPSPQSTWALSPASCVDENEHRSHLLPWWHELSWGELIKVLTTKAENRMPCPGISHLSRDVNDQVIEHKVAEKYRRERHKIFLDRFHSYLPDRLLPHLYKHGTTKKEPFVTKEAILEALDEFVRAWMFAGEKLKSEIVNRDHIIEEQTIENNDLHAIMAGQKVSLAKQAEHINCLQQLLDEKSRATHELHDRDQDSTIDMTSSCNGQHHEGFDSRLSSHQLPGLWRSSAQPQERQSSFSESIEQALHAKQALASSAPGEPVPSPTGTKRKNTDRDAATDATGSEGLGQRQEGTVTPESTASSPKRQLRHHASSEELTRTHDSRI